MTRVSATVLNRSRLVVTVPPDVPVADLKDWGEDIAEITQDRIARDFDREYGAGKALKGVTDEHEQRKARDGLLLTKGHMTGELQSELDAGGFARVQARKGRIDITFDEQELYSRAPHAEHFVQQKVSGKRLLVPLQKDARQAEQYVRERIKDLAAA